MTEAPLRTAALEVVARDGDAVRVRDPAGAEHRVTASEWSLLRGCDRYRSIRDHATALAKLPGVPPGWRKRIARALKTLTARGLLVAPPDLPLVAPEELDPLRRVGVITRDRPDLVARCVRSVLDTCGQLGRDVAITVYADGPATPLPAGVRVIDDAARTAWAERLIAAGAPASPLRFALFGDPRLPFRPGANRNLLLLDHLGHRVLQLDDDTVFRTAPHPEARPTPRVSSRPEPADLWFFPDPAAAVAAADPQPRDLLAAHDALLGRSGAHLLGGTADPAAWDDARPDLAARVASGDAAVRLTFAGTAGDAGTGTMHGMIYLDRATGARARAGWDGIRHSRAVWKVVDRPTVTRGPTPQMMAVGFDQRAPLPPVFPVGRGMDALATLVVGHLDPNALTGLVPLAITHLPGSPRVPDPDSAWRGITRCGLVDAVRWTVLPQRDASLAALAARLEAVTRADLEAMLQAGWESRRAALCGVLERRLDALSDPPAAWLTDVRRTLEHARTTGALPPPHELLHHPDPLAIALDLIQAWAHLLAAWPELCRLAQAHPIAGSVAAPSPATFRT